VVVGLLITCFLQSGRLNGQNSEQKKEDNMAVKLQWLGHASFKISDANTIIYIDPWKMKSAAHDATIVLVSHSHYDHYSAEDIGKVSDANTKLVAAADVVSQHGKGEPLKPGQTITVGAVKITGVAAYNPAKKFHPKANNWLGFVIEIGGKRIYYAGDTDAIQEMKAMTNIDVALLPAGGTYTMNAAEAAEATKAFKPKMAVPYHWGDIVGGKADAEQFAKSAACPVKILSPGEPTDIN